MAQRLFERTDGSYAFVSTDQKWTALGAPWNSDIPLLTASQAMSATGMDQMTLIEAPLFGRVNTTDGVTSDYKMPKNKGILLQDRDFGITKPVGVTGVNRTTTQFHELAYPMDALIAETGGTIETFGLLEPGGQWFCVVRLPDEVMVGGDLHHPYVWGIDGLWSNYVVQPRLMRFSCLNQMPLALVEGRKKRGAGAYVMRHTSRAEVDLKAMRASTGLAMAMAKDLDVIATIMLDQRFVNAEFTALTDDLFGVPQEDPKTGKIPASAKVNYRKRNNALLELFSGNPDSTESTMRAGYQTKWTAFQAISEYIDWIAPVKGSNAMARRLERTMDNSVQNIKLRALEALR